MKNAFPEVVMFFWVCGVVALLYWSIQVVATRRLLRHVPFLDTLQAPELTSWPKISIIIPARDEAEEIEAALRSRLAEGYPNIELIVINDRSTDETGAIIDRVAAEDPRVISVHVTALAPGWLGKQHAMQEGLRWASGEYVLFSDADIHFRVGVLRRCIAFCEAHRIDHLALLPELRPVSPVLDAAMVSFIRMVVLAARPWQANVPEMRGGVGVGAFNLLRRSAFDRTPGLEGMRMEVTDDLVLGQMMRQAGARGFLALAGSWVGLRYYPSLSALLRASERSAHAFKYRLSHALAGALAVFAIEATPFVALLSGAPGPALLGALSLAVGGWVLLVCARVVRLPRSRALLAPLGGMLLAAFTAIGAIRVARQGGLRWRGTLYRSEELLAASRFRLP